MMIIIIVMGVLPATDSVWQIEVGMDVLFYNEVMRLLVVEIVARTIVPIARLLETTSDVIIRLTWHSRDCCIRQRPIAQFKWVCTVWYDKGFAYCTSAPVRLIK